MAIQLNRIFKNSSISILQNAFNIIVSVFVNGYIAAELGAAAYGKFVFAFAFPQVFSVIADFGLQGYYTKKIAGNRERTREYLGEMTVLRMVLSIVAVILTAVAMVLTGRGQDTQIAVLIGTLSVLIAQTLITNAWAVFQAHEDVKYCAVSNIMSRIVVAALSVAVLRMGGSLLAVTGVYALGYFVQVVYCFRVLALEHWLPVFSLTRDGAKEILKAALPFSLYGIFSYLALQVDKTMLSLIKGDEALGIYNAASSLCINSNMISIAVANAVFPTLVQSYKQNRMDDFARKMQIILKWMILLGMPLAIIISFYAEEIVLFIYHKTTYMPSVIVLRILIWMLPIDLVSRIMRYALIAGDKEHSVSWFYGWGLAVNVVLNLILMPLYSYTGAACASIVTQAFLLILQGTKYFDSLPTPMSLPFARIIMGNALMGAALWLWVYKVNWIVGSISSAVMFFGMMFLLDVINKQDFLAVIRKKGFSDA